MNILDLWVFLSVFCLASMGYAYLLVKDSMDNGAKWILTSFLIALSFPIIMIVLFR